MTEPEVRFHTEDAIKFVSRRLGLPNLPVTQDWAFEVVKPSHLDRYLSLYEETSGEDDVRFVLADMIIHAFEYSDVDLDSDDRWIGFLRSLIGNVDLHAYQICYWAALGDPPELAWRVSPSMRAVCEVYFSDDP